MTLARARRNKRPIFILGNQKSGTTAIAALLGAVSGYDVTLDLQSEVGRPTLQRVRLGEIRFADVVATCGADFGAPLIKEPNLTFYVDELDRFFARPRYAFVVRDPRDTIRSILNRLSLNGTDRCVDADAWAAMPPGWHWILDNRWQGIPAENHLESLARRWMRAAEIYHDHRDRMRLLRYEDFVADKAGEIRRLADDLGLPADRPIDHLVEVQFQPRGNRQVEWDEFFGQRNLSLIEEVCAAEMRSFGYDS